MRITSTSHKPAKVVPWTVGAVAALAIVAAPAAGADAILPTAGNGPASDAVAQLQSAGYTVSVNYTEGHPNVPLNECRVTNIYGLGRTGTTTSSDVMTMLMEPEQFDTVSLDVNCPNAK